MRNASEMQRVLVLFCIIFLCLYGIYVLVSSSPMVNAAYYDDTSIESRVNVTNKGPVVKSVDLYEYDDGDTDNIELSDAGTEQLVCNATVDDWNGWADIGSINGTIYDSDNYNSRSANDNNYHYFNATCTNSSINTTSMEVSCSFHVWYYANNATWNCNISVIDTFNATNTSIDSAPPIVAMLAALNLSTSVLDFGEMAPGLTTLDIDEQLVNISNTGNTAINLSVDGFGAADGDELAMDCTVGNISIDFLRYNITPGETFSTNMYNLTDSQLASGIPGFSVPSRVDDGDNKKVNSTNSTYWKVYIPLGTRGFCNGTVTFSAVV